MSGRRQGTCATADHSVVDLSAADRPVVDYSTVTDLARLRGLSMSRPSANAVW